MTEHVGIPAVIFCAGWGVRDFLADPSVLSALGPILIGLGSILHGIAAIYSHHNKRRSR